MHVKKKKQYTHNEIKSNFDKIEKNVCDILPLAELRKLLENGWIIYDTRPAINTDDVKYLTLVKVKLVE